jgi:hypothetical protein
MFRSLLDSASEHRDFMSICTDSNHPAGFVYCEAPGTQANIIIEKGFDHVTIIVAQPIASAPPLNRMEYGAGMICQHIPVIADTGDDLFFS